MHQVFLARSFRLLRRPEPSCPAVPLQPAERADYKHLPQPVRYEELQREVMSKSSSATPAPRCPEPALWLPPVPQRPFAALTARRHLPCHAVSLKPDLFEGLRFDMTKPLNHNFALTHSIFMGNVDVPTANQQVVKMPIGTYEFGANLVTNGGNLLLGRITSDGRLTGRIKYDLAEWASLKTQFQVASERGMSQGMFDIDMKGVDWNGQLKYGTSQFYGANYFQSVTPHLALGGEFFHLAEQRRSGVGLAARHQTDTTVATAQVANTGLLSLSYLQRVSDKVSLVTDFTFNSNSREASAAFGYDYLLRQCRLRGRVDTEGKVGAFLEERVNVGVNFILSAEIDYLRRDYKFGFGMTVGE